MRGFRYWRTYWRVVTPPNHKWADPYWTYGPEKTARENARLIAATVSRRRA